ncbi:MAG: hypothetical protein ACWGMZ_12615 [Thermoguttaceae bacterium]
MEHFWLKKPFFPINITYFIPDVFGDLQPFMAWATILAIFRGKQPISMIVFHGGKNSAGPP